MEARAGANARFDLAREGLDRVKAEVAKVYIGSRAPVESLLVSLLARGHVLLEGVPGVAKTTLVKTFARTLDCSFRRIQFTPDMLPADITGTYVLEPQTGRFELRKGPVFAHVVLGDVINRAPAKTQSALLEAMQEDQVTIEGESCALPSPFMVLATQNPVEQEGVYLLPEAQLDRFVLKCEMGYPTEDDERRLLTEHVRSLEGVEAVLHPDDILELQRLVDTVHLDPGLVDYILGLVRYTREHPRVSLGASPRAALMMAAASRARALIEGRDYVLPDDVRALAGPVLAHRVFLTPEAEIEGMEPVEVIEGAVADVRYAG